MYIICLFWLERGLFYLAVLSPFDRLRANGLTDHGELVEPCGLSASAVKILFWTSIDGRKEFH
jgi:hypothetical protein